MYFGIIYQTNYDQEFIEDPDDIFHWFVAIIIFVPSLQFFFGWVMTILINLLSIVHKNNIKIFRLLTLNMIDANEFRVKYIQESDQGSIYGSSDSDNDRQNSLKVNTKEIGFEDDAPLDFADLFDLNKMNKTSRESIEAVQQRLLKQT